MPFKCERALVQEPARRSPPQNTVEIGGPSFTARTVQSGACVSLTTWGRWRSPSCCRWGRHRLARPLGPRGRLGGGHRRPLGKELGRDGSHCCVAGQRRCGPGGIAGAADSRLQTRLHVTWPPLRTTTNTTTTMPPRQRPVGVCFVLCVCRRRLRHADSRRLWPCPPTTYQQIPTSEGSRSSPLKPPSMNPYLFDPFFTVHASLLPPSSHGGDMATEMYDHWPFSSPLGASFSLLRSRINGQRVGARGWVRQFPCSRQGATHRAQRRHARAAAGEETH